ncbi:MAG: SpoIID/LytB domain-containing protein [bacterium]|nr:SpoIID/LytB domain-containing protein [bacterium]
MQTSFDARACVGLGQPADRALLITNLAAQARTADNTLVLPIAERVSAAAPAASHACRSNIGWRACKQQLPMPPQRGATLAASAATIAVALVCVLAVSYWLTILERTLNHSLDARTAVHRMLGIQTAYAANNRAPLLIRSHHMPVTVAPGETITLSLGFKNEAEWAWVRSTGSTAILERLTPNAPSRFMAGNWVDTMRATFQNDATIAPGSLALFTASFRAPMEAGTYTDTFTLRTLDGRTLAGSETEVTMIVTGPATNATVTSSQTHDGNLNLYGVIPAAALAAEIDTDPYFVAQLIRYPEEPHIRIGIEYEEPQDDRWFPHVVTSQSAFRVVTEGGAPILTARGGESVAVDFQPGKGTYHIKYNDAWYSSTEPLQFIPETPGALMQLPYYTDRLAWEGNTADNIFRGILEVRYVPSTERLWAINELPLEDYMRGLVETSDGAHPEFHKAQVIAARTFALYHMERGGKYVKGQFILRNDARDQVYRGENAALRRPNLVAAVEATRGIVATFNGDVAVTPYFAQSNGQTKGWHQVWGGQPRAWLTGVEDPACAGKREIGHGVGLAQRCAMTLANQGWSWQSILHHYYPGIQLQKIYE